MQIGILYAMKKEAEGLLRLRGATEAEWMAGMPCFRLSRSTVVCVGGVGKVNAAMAAQLLIDRFRVERIVNAGCAGALCDLPAGALVLGFVDDAAAPLAGLVDFEIAYPGCEQLKFFMATDRFFWNNGDFPEYVEYHREMEQYLPRALAEAEKKADEFGKEFAQRHHADPIHYFVGAGSQYGAAYSYAMCYWEEQHWLRAKAVHAGEFFHGTLEIIDRDTPVTVFLGEDAERPLAERVANFLPRICGNFTLIDSRDYELAGIRPEYRGSLSHLVTHAVTQRIDAHIELLNRHPMEIRRYYRCLDY